MSVTAVRSALRNEPRVAQPGEKIEKAAVGSLVIEEAQFAALAHIRHDLYGTAQVGIGVPG
jgi:hypothetical protein